MRLPSSIAVYIFAVFFVVTANGCAHNQQSDWSGTSGNIPNHPKVFDDPFRLILLAHPQTAQVGQPITITEVLVNISDEPVPARFHSMFRSMHALEEDLSFLDKLRSTEQSHGQVTIEVDAFQSYFPHGEIGSHPYVQSFEPCLAQSKVYTITATRSGVFALDVSWTSTRPVKLGGDVWVGTVRAKPLRITVVKDKEMAPATTQPATQP